MGALDKEKEMLQSMTHDQVVNYATAAASNTEDSHTTELREAIQKALFCHEDSIAKIEVTEGNNLQALQDHQERERQQKLLVTQSEQRTKEAIVEVLMQNAKKRAEITLRKDLLELTRAQLLHRAGSHGIFEPKVTEDDRARRHRWTLVRAIKTVATDGTRHDKRVVHNQRVEQMAEAQLIEQIVNVELGRQNNCTKLIRWWRRLRLLQSIISRMQTQCCCPQSLLEGLGVTVTVTIVDEGPLGIKFHTCDNKVRIADIREYSQAALQRQLRIGLELHAINRMDIGSAAQQRSSLLQMLRDANRPVHLTFFSNRKQQMYVPPTVDTNDTFWDDDHNSDSEASLSPETAGKMEYLHEPEPDDSIMTEDNDVSTPILPRRQRNNTIHFAPDLPGYSFETCSIHVENVPDIEQRHLELLFALFGQVIQITVKTRPGVSSNWVLVTMSDTESVSNILSSSPKYIRKPTDEQAQQLQRIRIAPLGDADASRYGHSWLEAADRAEAFICALANASEEHNQDQLRNDYGLLAKAPNGAAAASTGLSQSLAIRRRVQAVLG